MHREDFLSRPFYFGWFVVSATFVIKFVSVGSIYYSWGSFLKPLASQFGWTRGQVSASSTILLVSNALAFWLIGALVDRRGARVVVRASAVLAGCGFFLLSKANSLVSFYLVAIVLGVSFAGLGSLPAFAAVSQWFKVKRGLALGISSVGPGAGAMVLVPVVNRLIITFGLQRTFVILAILVAGVALPLSTVLRPAPETLDRRARNEGTGGTMAGGPSTGMSLRQSARTPAFWLLLSGVILFSVAMGGVVTHLMALLTDRGLTVGRAGVVVSAVGGMSMLGRVLSGYVLDRITTKKYVMVGFNLSLVTAICLLLAGSHLLSLAVFAMLFGLATGAETDTLAYLVGAYFGLGQFGKIFGVMFSFFNLGLGAGSFFMGYAFDMRGNYQWGLGWLVASAALGALAMAQIRQPATERTPFSEPRVLAATP